MVGEKSKLDRSMRSTDGWRIEKSGSMRCKGSQRIEQESEVVDGGDRSD